MLNNDWNPGHSTNKGYPYDSLLSEETFKNRPDVWFDRPTQQVVMRINQEHFPQNPVWPEKRTEVESFLMARILDYNEALLQAEGQIRDILHEMPFNPTEFGFEEVLSHGEGEAPMRIFASIADGNFSMFRKPGDPNDPEWNPNMWTLMKKKIVDGHTVFQETDIVIPCRRIAFATLYALGVKFPEPKEIQKIDPGPEKPLNQLRIQGENEEKLKNFKLNFKRGDIDQDFDVLVGKKCNDKDAVQKVKFLIEAGATILGEGIEDVKFEEITVIQSQKLKRQRT